MTRKRVGVLISGRGSNLQALINACKSRDYPAEIVLVVSNVPQAQGLLRAEAALIPTLTINNKDFPDREAFDATPANIEAHTMRSKLPGGLELALLPKKTRGGAVFAGLALALWVSHHTCNGLNRLRSAAQRIAGGDLSPPARRHDRECER